MQDEANAIKWTKLTNLGRNDICVYLTQTFCATLVFRVMWALFWSCMHAPELLNYNTVTFDSENK